MRLLVTGAMGHIGYGVVERAAARGHRVVAQYRKTFSAARAAAISGDIEWIALDLADRAGVDDAISRFGITHCLHSAAIAHERDASRNLLLATDSNVVSGANLMEAMKRSGGERFILVSTGSVFQNVDVNVPLDEDARTYATNVYSTTKRCAELLTSMYRTVGSLSAATVRISMVYGPPITVAAGSLLRGPVPACISAALAGVPIIASGRYEASYTYVDDVLDGLVAALEAPTLNHDVYHLAPGINYSGRDLVQAVKAAIPSFEVEIEDSADLWVTYAAMRGPMVGDRLQADTGFAPRFSLDSGVAAYIDWWRSGGEISTAG